MSKRRSSKSKLPVICGADDDLEGPAGLPSDGNTGGFPLVTREDVISESSKGPGSPHPSCKVSEAHVFEAKEFDKWCSNKPADSSSSSTSSSSSDSSSNSDSTSNSSSSSKSSKSKSGGRDSSPGRSGKSGSAKGDIDRGGDSKPIEGDQESQDNDDEDFEEDDQDGKSSGHREEKGSDEEEDVDVEGDNPDNDGDDGNDQDDQDEARKTLILPPQGPKKRDTDTELDKLRADWFTNEMNVILDQRLGPNHIPFAWFESEIDEVVVRHKQYSVGVMHKCKQCENLPLEQKPCMAYKMFFRSDGTKISEDESKEKFVQDLHTVIKFYLEEEKFLDWGETGQAISHDPSTPPVPSSPGSPAPSSQDSSAPSSQDSSAPSSPDPPASSSTPRVPSLPVPRPVLSEHLEKYFRDIHAERCLKRSRLSNKMCVTHAIKTGLSRDQVRAIFDELEAERKQRKPMIKHEDKNWRRGTEILQNWQRENPRAPRDEDYDWLAEQTGRTRHQINNSLKQFRRKVLHLNLNIDGEDLPAPKRRFPKQVNYRPAAPKEAGGKQEAYKALLKEMDEERRKKNEDQRAVASTSKVVKNKRHASSRRLSDEGAPKVARTAKGDNIGPQAGEESSTRKLKNKRQASLRKLSGQGPGKVAKSAAETSGIIGAEDPTSLAQGFEVPPEDEDLTFNLDDLPIHDAWNPTRSAPGTDLLDGLDLPDLTAGLDSFLGQDADLTAGLQDPGPFLGQDAEITAGLQDPFMGQDADLTGAEVDADDIENEDTDKYFVFADDIENENDRFEPRKEEAVASLQSGENSWPVRKPRTKRIKKANSEVSPAPDTQTSYCDHDYDWFAQEIWGQMGGKKGPAIFPSAEDKIGAVVQKYENWSKGNLRHLQDSCDDSSDAKLCCYKGFDPSKDGDKLLLKFKAEIIRTLNEMIQSTPGQRLHQFPQHAKDLLWELSGRVDGEYRLSAIDRKTLVKKTGLEDEQIQKWWYHFHNKKKAKQKVEVPAKRSAPEQSSDSGNIQGGELAQEETDSDNTTSVDEENMEQDDSSDFDNSRSVQPFRSGVYENAFRAIFADMGGSKGENKFPGVEAAVQPIIDLYKLWVKGRPKHLHRRCDSSSDPLFCCWTKKFGPPKKPPQVFLEFQVEVTRTINKIIREVKLTQPSVKIHRFPDFSRQNMQKHSDRLYPNALHDLDKDELVHLKGRTGLEPEQIRKWWEQYHNRRIKQDKKGAITSIKEGGEIPKKQGPVVKTPKTQRGQDIDKATLANIFEEIVDKMTSLSWAGVFAKPISKEEAPDYLDFVGVPMDLDIIKKKACQKLYRSGEQFRRDVWQIVLNAHTYYDNEAAVLHNMPIPHLAEMLIKKVDEELTNRKNEIKACVDRYNEKNPNKTAEAQKKSREEAGADLAALNTIFGSIVNKLYQFNVEPFHKDLFVNPVTTSDAPDYPDFVNIPMDLGLIRKKAFQRKYKSQDEFRLDVKQIVINTHKYNDKKSKSKHGDSRIPPRAEGLFQQCNKELKMRQDEIEACMKQS